MVAQIAQVANCFGEPVSQLKEPLPVKLVVALLAQELDHFKPCQELLQEYFGGVITVSPTWVFDWSCYYSDEMGSPLQRLIVVFEGFFERDQLVAHKLICNDIEKQLTQRFGNGPGRVVNVDPGHLAAEKFVLATGKNYTHRIYLHDGIFADLTLMFGNKRYQPLPWTYPDYASDDVIDWFMSVRSIYLKELKERNVNGLK